MFKSHVRCTLQTTIHTSGHTSAAAEAIFAPASASATDESAASDAALMDPGLGSTPLSPTATIAARNMGGPTSWFTTIVATINAPNSSPHCGNLRAAVLTKPNATPACERKHVVSRIAHINIKKNLPASRSPSTPPFCGSPARLWRRTRPSPRGTAPRVWHPRSCRPPRTICTRR